MKLINLKEYRKERQEVYSQRICDCGHLFREHFDRLRMSFYEYKSPPISDTFCKECPGIKKSKHMFSETFESFIHISRQIRLIEEKYKGLVKESEVEDAGHGYGV